MNQKYKWKNRQIRDQIAVIDGKLSPSILLKNARILHSIFKKWMIANIWIFQDRIIYVGKELPKTTTNCEVVDCSGYTLVPGYIEPHAHPFNLYNPSSLARYAAQTGTTTLINDNLAMVLNSDKKKAFSLIRYLDELPVSMYWWTRYDSQTELKNEETMFTNGDVKSWLEHDGVIQGGELTGWPKLLAGDDLMLHWIQETKRLGKKVEGHFPGASEATLAKMKLFGADGDHESMTGEDVVNRLMHGYTVALRHSSIRPDLPKLLQELLDLKVDQFDSLILTTDGATPSFYRQGMIDMMVKIALENGISAIDAYHMASYNVARYYNILDAHGMIATGRIANINFLTSEQEPTPISVLAKGQWVKKAGKELLTDHVVDWNTVGFESLQLDWELLPSDMQFSMPFGIEMINNVITKPYTVKLDISLEYLPAHQDESFLMLMDRKGKWRLNTMIKGFASDVSGFSSSFSNTGDIIIIGKVKKDMKLAFNRMKEIGGGIVLAENGKVIYELRLPLSGLMSDLQLEDLMKEEEKLRQCLLERGYPFTDPLYSLLFFTATHLPYIRITPRGIYDVKNKIVLFPALMR